MAEAVLGNANEWLETTALAPLTSERTAHEKLVAMGAALTNYYDSGRESCLLELLSQNSSRGLFAQQIQAAIERWIQMIAVTLAEAGLPKAIAAQRAEDAVITVQGALVVSRGTGSTAPFERTIKELPQRLLAPHA